MKRRARPAEGGLARRELRLGCIAPSGLAPSGFVLLCLALGGCTERTELLPASTHDAGVDAALAGDGGPTLLTCPTSIDIYGAIDATQSACAGAPAPPLPVSAGYFMPGAADYDGTLAGRLQAIFSADPELAARFGAGLPWKIRSCATNRGSLSAYSALVPMDECTGSDAPTKPGALDTVCSLEPAPLTVFLGSEQEDRCHGGGSDSMHADDPSGFARHYADRLDDIVATRMRAFLVVGPATVWMGRVGPPSVATCTDGRDSWTREGVRLFAERHAQATNLYVAGDLEDDFKAHGGCCQALGLSCGAPWVVAGPSAGELPVPNCEGGRAITEYWARTLKALLLSRQWSCGG